MKKRLFHRGHHIENVTNTENGWTAVIEGRSITHSLALVKKSIDWWYDMNTFMHPEKLVTTTTRKPQQARVVDYKGFKIRNDSGEHNQWYVIAGTRLLKGNVEAIKKHLDAALSKQQTR
ncbi:DUF3319 domain-containing protein [Photobacterium japonica]|uniref:DUF3319 domain-containing protein n=1 Tax=Photobacterium japonica TaxID=2910235 RepID=UPI003D0A6F78